MVRTRRPPLPNLTSIRFFAASAVFLFHVHDDQSIFRAGHLGVNLFFVLSGFILAYNHPSVADNKKFYLARFARIYPLYIFAMLTALPLFIVHNRLLTVKSIAGTALFLTLLQAWWPAVANIFNPPAWTLSHEAFFYLVFPFVLPWLRRHMRSWIWLSLACWGFMVGSSTFLHFIWMPTHPAHALTLRSLLNVPLFRVGEFLIGILFGLHFEKHRPTFRAWSPLAAVAICVPFIYLVEITPLRHQEVATNGLVAIPFAILIYALAGWKSPVLGHPVLQVGGEISYGIYLLQVPLGFYMTAAMRRYDLHISAIWLFLVTVGFCYLTYTFIEKPARIYLLNLFGYRSHPKPIETTAALP